MYALIHIIHNTCLREVLGAYVEVLGHVPFVLVAVVRGDALHRQVAEAPVEDIGLFAPLPIIMMPNASLLNYTAHNCSLFFLVSTV